MYAAPCSVSSSLIDRGPPYQIVTLYRAYLVAKKSLQISKVDLSRWEKITTRTWGSLYSCINCNVKLYEYLKNLRKKRVSQISIVGSVLESSRPRESKNHIGNTKRYDSFRDICQNVHIMWTIELGRRRFWMKEVT